MSIRTSTIAGVLVAAVVPVSIVHAASCVPAVWPSEKEKWTWHEDAGEGPGIHITTDIAFHDGTWYSVGTQNDYLRCARYWPEGEEVTITLATSADGLFEFVVDESINPIVEPVDRIGELEIEYGDNRNVFFPCFGKNPDGSLATWKGRFVLMVNSETKERQTIHQCLFSEDMKHWTDRTVVEPLSFHDEQEPPDAVREPHSLIRDDDGTWYMHYGAHSEHREEALVCFASGPSPVELTRGTLVYRDVEASLDAHLLRDAQSWLVLYNTDRAENRFLRIEQPGATDWGPGEDYFESHHSPKTTTFAWTAIVNEADETVTWRLYQYTMKRWSDKTIQGGAFEATVPLDKTVHTLRRAPHKGSGAAPFSVRSTTVAIEGGVSTFNCLGRIVFGGRGTGRRPGASSNRPGAGLRIVSLEEEVNRSYLPCMVINDEPRQR